MFKFISKTFIFMMAFFMTNQTSAYQAIIFDCDGVLVDSEYLKYCSWHAVLATAHTDLTEEAYMPLVGLSTAYIAKTLIDKYQLSFSLDTLIQLKNEHYQLLQKQGVPILHDGLQALHQAIKLRKTHKIKLGLASSAAKVEIMENIRQLGVRAEDFDVILSGESDLAEYNDPEGVNKPKPYIYLHCAKLLGVQPNKCIVFEDTNAGVVAASSAGMDVIAVPNRFTIGQNFSRAMKISCFNDIDIEALVTPQQK